MQFIFISHSSKMELSTQVLLFLSVGTLFVQCQASLPSEQAGRYFPPTKPQENSKLLKQNSRYRPSPINCRTNDSKIGVSLLSGIADERYRWKKGFFVQADRAFNRREMRLFNEAMYELDQVLCIPVNVWTRDSRPVKDYVFFRRGPVGSGCFSPIGRVGGRQVINLEAGRCMNKATIMHEAIHSLGFNHEQTRTDRDKYINIYWRNILPGMDFNFRKFRGSLTYDTPYDYKSIMHYDSYSFSRNGRPTIVAKNGQQIGFNSVLSPFDIVRLRKMYNCDDDEDSNFIDDDTTTTQRPSSSSTSFPDESSSVATPDVTSTPPVDDSNDTVEIGAGKRIRQRVPKPHH